MYKTNSVNHSKFLSLFKHYSWDGSKKTLCLPFMVGYSFDQPWKDESLS